MIISIIVALGKNNVIGSDNKLPWRLKADMKKFVSLTTGKPVIMGRKTFESIGRPLKNRTNIILTRTDYAVEDAVVVSSIDEALKAAHGSEEVMIIGGASIYEQFLPLADRLYITYVDCNADGDAFFPDFNKDEWNQVSREEHKADSENTYDYTFVVLERRTD
ncbi:MAG: type 3 dihydrofolate reductase [Candidatus Aenigmarchaeota archaeon]|nr:type 3 dihydrofolate reductase [Candidatus Aenigmarchaeota archaeon]